jgi:hypothetical protein
MLRELKRCPKRCYHVPKRLISGNLPMKVSISYKVQEVFDKALSDPSIDPTRPITGRGYKVWVDEPTGTLCKVSTLSGTVMGFVSVSRDHPWFSREDCPLPGISSYGTISHPVECRG